jgi:hypothetical protein
MKFRSLIWIMILAGVGCLNFALKNYTCAIYCFCMFLLCLELVKEDK